MKNNNFVNRNVKGDAIKYSILAFLITFVFLMAEFIASKAGLFGNELKSYVVDSIFRIIFGAIGLIILVKVCHENLKEVCTNKIPKVIWLLLIPVYVYFISYFTEISMVEIVSGKYWVLFLGSVLQQITTGLFEETVSRGIVMSAFRSHYENFKWRFSAVIISGVVFGLGHIFNFLFGGSVGDSLIQAFTSACWGMFIAALYMVSNNLILVMAIHTIWDIWIRIPDFFFGLSEEVTVIASAGQVLRDVIDPFLLGILAIVICIKYDAIKNTLNK